MSMIKTLRRLFPAAMSTMFALINPPESSVGYIVIFCLSLIVFWLFDAPEKESIDKIDRRDINIDVPIEFNKAETGINLQK